MNEPQVEKGEIDQADLDPGFFREVAARSGGEDIARCYACGTCTASCPVSVADPSFDPRRVIRMILLGMRREVFESEFMWLCAGCGTCTDRCPQGVSVSGIMVIVRNMALERGVVHISYRLQVGEILKYGRLYEAAPFNKRREKMSLPPLTDDPAPVAVIMERTDLARIARSGEGEGGGEK